MTQEQARAVLLLVANAIIDTVKEAGEYGAPGGTLYVACMVQGMSFDMFQQIMEGLVAANKLRKTGELYFAV